jgi:hypothetical protein
MLGVLVLAKLKARAPLLLCKVAQVSLRALGLCGRIGGFFCLLCVFFLLFSSVFPLFSIFLLFLCHSILHV